MPFKPFDEFILSNNYLISSESFVDHFQEKGRKYRIYIVNGSNFEMNMNSHATIVE